MKIPKEIRFYLDKIVLPDPKSHKGQNGKLLIIGGSELFHAASKWSLDVAAKFVDMVFYASVPSNNELVKEAKANFWNGIVVPLSNLDDYLEEADCILIGPGMERDKKTAATVDNLLRKYPAKKWVIDAGALQMVNLDLLNSPHIITPHQKEYQRLKDIKSSTLLLKGPVDLVVHDDKKIEITGGNAGMTKGGTGDVLAGLVAALYCTHDALTSSVVASYVNKKAGEALYHQVGPYFNASDLAATVPKILWKLL